jgi:hypothetical protein
MDTTAMGRNFVKAGMMVGFTCATLGVAAGAAWAQQSTTSSPADKGQQVQARFQIAAMEAVLERAVQLGAQKVRVQVQEVAPELLFVNGAPRARGFWLEGYGVFFDVDVPPMRRSMMWSMRMLDQSDRNVEVALRDLRREVEAVGDPASRRTLLQAVQQVEQRVGPTPAVATGGSQDRTAVAQEQRPARSPAVAAILEDPGLAYTSEVKTALIDTMIEYSGSIPLAPDQVITVAARDQEGTRLQPGDPYEVSTILLRVRGSDLAAYRAQQIDRDEVRRRVEIREY